MRILPFTLAVIASSTMAADWEKWGPQYEAKSAFTKEQELWAQITANTQSNRWFSSVEFAGIFVESMDPTMHWVGDTFQNGWTGSRNKYIHTVGSSATFKFVPTAENIYTGVFEGSDHGIIRFSVGVQPDYTKTTEAGADGNFAPGIGVKFLRDGMPSGNMVAMYSTDGQPSWNFFDFDFTNHIPDPKSAGGAAIANKFATVTPFIQYVGVSDMATYGQSGHKATTPKFPFELIYRPDPSIKSRFPSTFDKAYTEQIASIESGATVYQVMAREEPTSELTHIGDIVLTSQPTNSYFGDKYLFFKHQDLQEDLALKPEWKSYVHPFTSLAVGAGCPFAKLNKVSTSYSSYIKQVFGFYY